MNSENNKPSKSFQFQQKRFKQPAPPSYGDLINNETKLFKCDICLNQHATNTLCESKPPFPPDYYFRKCRICLGFHPNGQCYFENLKEIIDTHSHCKNCNFSHNGFCKAELLCLKCEKRHNSTDDCTVLTHRDLSKNLCPKCNSYHSSHCYDDLQLIESGLILWCNRCKVEHPFLKWVPFCDKCQRNHLANVSCPAAWDYCKTCHYSHHGKLCPKSDQKPNTPCIIPNCAQDCNKCCHPVHFKQSRKASPQPHIYHEISNIINETVQNYVFENPPKPTKPPHRSHKIPAYSKPFISTPSQSDESIIEDLTPTGATARPFTHLTKKPHKYHNPSLDFTDELIDDIAHLTDQPLNQVRKDYNKNPKDYMTSIINSNGLLTRFDKLGINQQAETQL